MFNLKPKTKRTLIIVVGSGITIISLALIAASVYSGKFGQLLEYIYKLISNA